MPFYGFVIFRRTPQITIMELSSFCYVFVIFLRSPLIFIWDHFVVAGNPTVYENEYAGSRNVKADNMFNSPDGLAFDTLGNLWIQTDGNYSNQGDFEGMGNNQMIMADPSTGNLKRFLVGPKECEVTGMTWSSDKSTMFVGIQHPGEKNPKKCSFPGGKGTVPRSSIIAISRDDGGVMG